MVGVGGGLEGPARGQTRHGHSTFPAAGAAGVAMTLPIRLTDAQLHEVRQAAQTAPYDLRQAFLERDWRLSCVARISAMVSCMPRLKARRRRAPSARAARGNSRRIARHPASVAQPCCACTVGGPEVCRWPWTLRRPDDAELIRKGSDHPTGGELARNGRRDVSRTVHLDRARGVIVRPSLSKRVADGGAHMRRPLKRPGED